MLTSGIFHMVTNGNNNGTSKFSIQEYASLKDVSINTVRNWIKANKIDATMISNKWFVHDTNIGNNQENTPEESSTNHGTNHGTNDGTNQQLIVEILQSQIEHLKSELEESHDKIKRSDMVIMKLTSTVEAQQLQLTEATTPFWKKLFRSRKQYS